MDRLKINTWIRLFLIALMLVIGLGSILFTEKLVRSLASEERDKTELWARATNYVAQPELSEEDISLYLDIIRSNDNIPAIHTDENNNLLYSNMDSSRLNKPGAVERTIRRMKETNEPIVLIDFDGTPYGYVYYNHSLELRMLSVYPYVYLLLVIIFITTGFYALRASQRAEQNHVWVGLSKETAHQLGTPISSLLALTELLREQVKDEAIMSELDKDLGRLQMITDRFSKIGSKPVLVEENINEAIESTLGYMKKRSSGRVNFVFKALPNSLLVPLNRPLFGWVIENLCKNAIDAMEGAGNIEVKVTDNNDKVRIDFSDTGKGIPRKQFEEIFQPGFTSKSRGWGLGLSLSRRIIESYHKGRIFVFRSEIDNGTTFRIEFKKQ